MVEADVPAAYELMVAAFADLDRRLHEPPQPPPRDPGPGYVRLRRVLTSDPAGCWACEHGDGQLTGAGLAIMREGVWGLSLLVVRPDLQSAGFGSELLRRTLAYGDGARGGNILAAWLELRPGGAVMLRGDADPFHPCLPSGAYL